MNRSCSKSNFLMFTKEQLQFWCLLFFGWHVKKPRWFPRFKLQPRMHSELISAQIFFIHSPKNCTGRPRSLFIHLFNYVAVAWCPLRNLRNSFEISMMMHKSMTHHTLRVHSQEQTCCSSSICCVFSKKKKNDGKLICDSTLRCWCFILYEKNPIMISFLFF